MTGWLTFFNIAFEQRRTKGEFLATVELGGNRGASSSAIISPKLSRVSGGNRCAAAGRDFEHAILFSSVGWVERGEGSAYKWRVIETGHGMAGRGRQGFAK